MKKATLIIATHRVWFIALAVILTIFYIAGTMANWKHILE